MMPRLQNYPRGLGKGSDAGIVGAWLETILAPLTESDVPAPCLTHQLFTHKKSNRSSWSCTFFSRLVG